MESSTLLDTFVHRLAVPPRIASVNVLCRITCTLLGISVSPVIAINAETRRFETNLSAEQLVQIAAYHGVIIGG
jgi:hypothetical protein